MSALAPPRVAGPGPNGRWLQPPASRWAGLWLWLQQWFAHKPYPAPTRIQPRGSPAADGFSRAIECLHRGDWQAAFDAMAQAADRGDRRAARIALLMLERGPRLFSRRFSASQAQRTRWAEEPVRGSRR